jgi:hypothetical protein
MTDWQMTATTIFCDDIGEEVTIMVYKDGKTRCTGYDLFTKLNADVKSKKVSSDIECHGPVCRRVASIKISFFRKKKAAHNYTKRKIGFG